MVAGRARISRNVKSQRSYSSRSHPRRYPQISAKKVDYDYDYEHEQEHDTVFCNVREDRVVRVLGGGIFPIVGAVLFLRECRRLGDVQQQGESRWRGDVHQQGESRWFVQRIVDCASGFSL